ncbi:MAG: Glu-tRNA(Gln) amidotransferase subunit GatD [Nanoarchaeota archaeon]|nr:Glu-tRNA(Gln) amidotransferase subunit GatD [Nanoarchaeota archaeon]
MTNPGDTVEVVTSDKTFSGTLMPNAETDAVVLKLDSGYNLGIAKDKVKSVKTISARKERKETFEKVVAKKGLPTIAILHTGGTIASKVDYETGGVSTRFEPDELLAMFPELQGIANIKSTFITQMFSEDMRFAHYPLMCDAVRKEVEAGVDGIIIAHGTDTFGYSLAALGFALKDLPIPVILVGAQRSSDRGSSDATLNLLSAAYFIAESDFSGVAGCMHETVNDTTCLLLPCGNTRKMHSSRRDAFKVVNGKPIARVDFEKKQVTFMSEYVTRDESRKLIVKDGFEQKVGILKFYPNLMPEQILSFKGFAGVVIEGTGLGQGPVSEPNKWCKGNDANFSALKKLIDSGTIVVMCTQTIFGRVHMHVYSPARRLLSIGIISGEDMLSETAFIKLAWLLGNYSDVEQIKRLLVTNLRGEINEREILDDYGLG